MCFSAVVSPRLIGVGCREVALIDNIWRITHFERGFYMCAVEVLAGGLGEVIKSHLK